MHRRIYTETIQNLTEDDALGSPKTRTSVFSVPTNPIPSMETKAALIICHPELTGGQIAALIVGHEPGIAWRFSGPTAQPHTRLGQRPIGIYLERRSRKIRGAHASRVLVAASRRDELLALFADLGIFLKKSAGSSLWRDAKASTRDACAPQNRALSARPPVRYMPMGRCPSPSFSKKGRNRRVLEKTFVSH